MPQTVIIPIAKESQIELKGSLQLPTNSTGLVIFAHGSSSSATSSRNQMVAKIINENGFATLLFDLLTVEEQDSDIRTQNMMCKIPGLRLNKFNIELLREAYRSYSVGSK